MQKESLQSLGEFGLINHLAKGFKNQNKSSIKGIGDDAAVIDAGDHYHLVTSDCLVEGVHFDLRYVPLKHLGYKAVAVNVSDIAAMNGTPEQIVVSIALSSKFTLEAVEELYEGIRLACENYKVDLIGGDTSASPAGLFISITALGKADKNKVVYRNGAQKGDIICVTGDLGAAYIGLNILEREKAVFLENNQAQPDLENHAYAVGRQLKPEARMEIIQDLNDLKVVPTAMIDISDALSSELHHIASQSGCGMVIYEDKLPIADSVYKTAIDVFKIDPITCILNGGEDYELLFTVTQNDYEKIKNHPDISIIGYVHDKREGVKLISKGGQIVSINPQGWNHLKS